MPRLHLIHVARIQVASTSLVSLVAVYIVSCVGDKIVVTATCIHLYPRVEHCLELVSASTCIRRRRRMHVSGVNLALSRVYNRYM